MSPTIGLDPHQILIVRDLIGGLRGPDDRHHIEPHSCLKSKLTCDRVLIINQGRIVAQGTPDALRREILGRSRYELVVAGEPSRLEEALVLVDPACCELPRRRAHSDGFGLGVITIERDD